MAEDEYRIDDWVDAEHCVYHALIDDPKDLTEHRIAHFLGRLTAKLIENGTMTTEEVEAFLHTCRR